MKKEKKPNKLLRRERDLRGWSQGRLAEELKATVEGISNWERGAKTPSKHYQEAMCELFGKTAEELGFMEIEEEELDTSPGPANPPPDGNPGPATPPPNPDAQTTVLNSEQAVVMSIAIHSPHVQVFVQPFQNETQSVIAPLVVEASPYLVEVSTQKEVSAPFSDVHNEGIIPGMEGLGLEKGESNMHPERREFVKQTAQVGLLGALAPEFLGRTDLSQRLAQALKRPALIDTTLLEELRSSVTFCWTLQPKVAGVVSSQHLGTVRTHLAYLIELLESQLYPSVRQQLTSLAAECSLIGGIMYHNIQLPTVAERYYTTAYTAANEADNQALKASIRGRMSVLPVEHSRALAFLEEAAPLAKKYGTDTTYSWLLARKAEHLSVDPQYATECEKTLEQATTFSSKGDSEHDPYWTLFDESRMYGYQGSCYIPLQKLEAAKTATLQALQLSDPHDLIQQTDIQIDLLRVYEQLGDIINACLCGHRALALISRTRSPWHLPGLADFRSNFPPGETDAALQAFDEHKMSVDELFREKRTI